MKALRNAIMRTSQFQGMVLASTVLILSLLSLLILSQLQLVFLHYKALNQVIKKHQAFYELEAEASQLASKMPCSLQEACLSKAHDVNEIIHSLKNKQGCILRRKGQDYFYLTEDLGVFPCMQARFKGKLYSTQHLRINLRSTGSYFAFLQLRIARLTEFKVCQDNQSKLIKIGLLSWRLIEG